jgi:3-isopropylmalate dehydrogenase
MLNIGVIRGDGVGPEIIEEGIKVINKAFSLFGKKINFIEYPFGGDYYLKTKQVLPDSAISEFKQLSAIYLGAIGHPQVPPGILERELLLKIRFELDEYINLRPVKLYEGVNTPIKDKSPEDIDFVVVRENTEDLYVGLGGIFKKGTNDEIAIQTAIYTRKGTERCIKYAYELAKKRNKKYKVTLCDKSNVLTYGHSLWQRVFYEVGKLYPEIEKDHAYVDALCMWMIKNPEWYDVIVTPNMFGDIITDLGAIIQGGLGVAAGANINPNGVSMFEPIHGSAPKYAGKNIINPLATIFAGMLMLEELKETKIAKFIEDCVKEFLKKGYIKDMSAGKMGLSTKEVGDLILKIMEKNFSKKLLDL